jgi:hypothetical protein
MPLYIFTTAISKISEIAVVQTNNWLKRFLHLMRHFYLSGKPISLHQLHCGPFAVVHYSSKSHFFANNMVRVGWRGLASK